LKTISNYDRVLVKRFTGGGKSYTINEVKKHFDDTFAYCAFTHTAVANTINGETLHHLFGVIFMTGDVSSSNFKRLIQNKKGLIVEEVSFVSRKFFRVLVLLLSIKPKSYN
jgi:hypothetical protein